MIKFTSMQRNRAISNLLLLLIPLSIQAQSRKCGFSETERFYRDNYPEYVKNRELAIREMASWKGNAKAAGTLIIPVVVHVVYRTDNQNISDEQIHSQIDALNRDYRAMNWDTMFINAPWKKLLADCNIEFRMADRDENGNYTTGITRTKTEIMNLTSPGSDNHAFTIKGGHEIWNRNNYLNIWVCEIAGLVYGFSSLPGSPASTDGIVIAFESFGTMGTATSPTKWGRTATHEVGHWLNLIHPWGDVTCGDDLVSDTPIQETGNFNCPKFPHITCTNGPNGDMFENYMDYTDDSCMHLFTLGQKSRMQACINTVRSSLFNSPGYNGISNPANLPMASVHPNPVGNTLLIEIPENDPNASYVLRDLNGGVFEKGRLAFTGKRSAMDVAWIPDGIYFLELITSKSAYTKRLLISH